MNEDVHTIAGLLKLLLRETEGVPIPDELREMFLHVRGRIRTLFLVFSYFPRYRIQSRVVYQLSEGIASKASFSYL
jgi:hypothetical protein